MGIWGDPLENKHFKVGAELSTYLYLIRALAIHVFYVPIHRFLDTATKGIHFLVDKIKKKK